MTLNDNNAVQLWRKTEADIRDAQNLMLDWDECNPHAHVCKILAKLRTATCAVQELERRMIGQGAPK